MQNFISRIGAQYNSCPMGL